MPTKSRIFLLSISSLIVLAASQSLARAQVGDDWQTFSPEGEEFSVVMPKNPKAEEGQETYHRMTLNTRLYLAQAANGPVLGVASLSGIKANSATYTEFQRLNSYVDAFKNWFPAKVAAKDAVVKLTLVKDKVLNGNAGREYQLVIGNLSGTAHMYATRRRFYAVVILNTKKDDALTERFLSSLMLPEKVAQPQSAAVNEEKPAVVDPAMPRQAKSEGDEAAKPDAPAASGTGVAKANDAAAPEKPHGERAPISGGVLNAKALLLPTPYYPPEARAAGTQGTVAVQVLIDETGSVISAKAVSGPPSLHQAAVSAAFGARFSPTTLMGEPVKVNGIITFNFVAK
jgi:TonB family protein